MIRKSKFSAIALMTATGLTAAVAAMGVTPPAFAQRIYSPSETGGGSWGYNHHMAIDQWRLRHNVGRHTPVHQLPSKAQ